MGKIFCESIKPKFDTNGVVFFCRVVSFAVVVLLVSSQTVTGIVFRVRFLFRLNLYNFRLFFSIITYASVIKHFWVISNTINLQDVEFIIRRDSDTRTRLDRQMCTAALIIFTCITEEFHLSFFFLNLIRCRVHSFTHQFLLLVLSSLYA